MSLKQYLDEFFYMTKSQRSGSVVLIVLLFLSLIFRLFVPVVFKDRTNYSEIIAKNMRMIDSFYGNDFNETDIPNTTAASTAEAELFVFDPNTVSNVDLLKLGLSSKTTNTFIKYRNRGAYFYKPDDILKVYGIDSTIFRKLKPFIQITSKTRKKSTSYDKRKQQTAIYAKEYTSKSSDLKNKQEAYGRRKEIPIIEINAADSALLTTLPGVGPVFASRICNFRKYLGGFYSIDQLLEVYNFPEETFRAIKPYLILDTLKVKTFNVNFCSVNDLKAHPYCTYEQARLIVDYRAKRGSINNVEQLAQDEVIDSVFFKRISPYLTTKVTLMEH